MNILRAFERVFDLGGPTWASWRALVGGAFGCPLDDLQAATFRELTGREPPAAPIPEQFWGIGRRGGKNRVSGAVAGYLALFKEWEIAPGETPTVLVLASDRVQAKVAFRYILGTLRSHPSLEREIASVTADTINLRNGIEIAIGTADNAAVRGRTIVACICDEFAFWPHEDAEDVLRALRPGMATQPGAMLIVISSVYAAYGPFYEARRRYYGVEDPRVLFAVATTRQMNPTISEEFVAAEIARDPGNMAEYLSVELSDRASFLDPGLIDQAERASPRELPRVATTRTGTPVVYRAGLDVSGGRGDAAAVAVAHRDGERVVVDFCRRYPAPHDPASVAAMIATDLRAFGLASALADQYGAELSRTIYAAAGVALTAAPDTRSDTYLRLLPLFTTGRLEIPPDPILRRELLGLERRTRSGGRDAVDHRPGAHDDLANATALAAVAASRGGNTGGTLSVVYSETALAMQREFGGGRTWPSY